MSARLRVVTYSQAKRRLLEDDKSSIKRRRVEDVGIYNDHKERTSDQDFTANSPLFECPSAEPPTFSDDANDCASTPPSLPPLVLIMGQFPDDSDRQRSRIATMKPNEMSSARLRLMAKPKEPQRKFGQSFSKKCRTCGMELVPSSSKDLALHRKYHA